MKVPYSDGGRTREEYRLTESGQATWTSASTGAQPLFRQLVYKLVELLTQRAHGP